MYKLILLSSFLLIYQKEIKGYRTKKNILTESDTAVLRASRCHTGVDCIADECDGDLKCVCDKMDGYFFDELNLECVVSGYLPETFVEKYDNEAVVRDEANKIFNGMIGAAIFFIICSVICVSAAFFYCCRIIHKDGGLRRDVEALNRRNKRDGKKNVKVQKHVHKSCIDESCPVITSDVMIV